MRSLQCTPGAAYCARCESGKYSDGNESTTCFRCGVREGYGQTQPEVDEYNSVIDCDSGALLGLRNDTWAPYGIDENNFNTVPVWACPLRGVCLGGRNGSCLLGYEGECPIVSLASPPPAPCLVCARFESNTARQ